MLLLPILRPSEYPNAAQLFFFLASYPTIQSTSALVFTVSFSRVYPPSCTPASPQVCKFQSRQFYKSLENIAVIGWACTQGHISGRGFLWSEDTCVPALESLSYDKLNLSIFLLFTAYQSMVWFLEVATGRCQLISHRSKSCVRNSEPFDVFLALYPYKYRTVRSEAEGAKIHFLLNFETHTALRMWKHWELSRQHTELV